MIAKALRFIARPLRRFRKNEDGAVLAEFLILFPPFMLIMLAAVEIGIMMTRHVMLERGLEMATRQVSLNTASTVSADQIKRMICNGAGIIPQCLNTVRVEMRRENLRSWTDIPATADCVDVNDPAKPAAFFQNGTANNLMVIRVCALFRPMLPTTGIGAQVPRNSGDYYALVSTSSFVYQPF